MKKQSISRKEVARFLTGFSLLYVCVDFIFHTLHNIPKTEDLTTILTFSFFIFIIAKFEYCIDSYESWFEAILDLLFGYAPSKTPWKRIKYYRMNNYYEKIWSSRKFSAKNWDTEVEDRNE